MYFIMLELEFEPKTEDKSASNDLRSPLDCLSSALGHRRGRSKHSSMQQVHQQLITAVELAAAGLVLGLRQDMVSPGGAALLRAGCAVGPQSRRT